MRDGGAGPAHVHEETRLRWLEHKVPKGRKEALHVHLVFGEREEAEGHPQLPPPEALEVHEATVVKKHGGIRGRGDFEKPNLYYFFSGLELEQIEIHNWGLGARKGRGGRQGRLKSWVSFL